MLLTAPIPSRLLSVFGDAEWSGVCYAATKRTGHQLSLRLDVWDGFDLDAPNHHHSFRATVAGFIFSEVQQLGASEGGLADGYAEDHWVLVYNCGIDNFQNVSKNCQKCLQKLSKYQNVS